MIRFLPKKSTLFSGLIIGCLSAAPFPTLGREITVDDVLAFERLDKVTVSPKRDLIATVIIRPAASGEVYGRTFHELDPSRADVVIIDRNTASIRNLTDGRSLSAGAWCATWSPDGSRLAMLSTRPEGVEPRGGDNVRLYVWERASGDLRRLGNWAVMTQTRAGGTIHKLDIASPGRTNAEACAENEDNPPFTWLDDNHLLAAILPDGGVSGLLDEQEHLYRRSSDTRDALHSGQRAIVSVSGSGGERSGMNLEENGVILSVVNADTGSRKDIAKLANYPFHGSLSIRVSPDKSMAVILATKRMIPYQDDVPVASLDGEFSVEKQLGAIRLDATQEINWITNPEAARLPLALQGWSKSGRTLRFTARANQSQTDANSFQLDAKSMRVSTVTTKAPSLSTPNVPEIPKGGNLVANDRTGLLWTEATPSGVFLRSKQWGSKATVDLLRLNGHLAEVDLGETRMIDYISGDGEPLKGLVILPPGYSEAVQLPVITWVYGGHVVRNSGDYFTDPYMPGLYNLRLYAARGYAILIPSIPLRRDGSEVHIDHLASAVLPAIDRLEALGIADPDRLGLMGQSYGGFTTLGLVTKTRRFRAAIALAAISDFTAFEGEFDRTAPGYSGIEHEKSVNIPIAEAGVAGLNKPFYKSADRYRQASPLSYVGQVTTPVLLIHGDHDERGSTYQSEAFFTGLWRQGKTARILRYAGENHGLGLSPATVRSAVDEITQWFDKYLAKNNGTLEPR